MDNKKKFKIFKIFIYLLLNLTAISFIALSILFAIDSSEKESLSQNVENVQNITNSQAEKVNLALEYKTEEVKLISSYITSYGNTGMMLSDLKDYIANYYLDTEYNWQIVNTFSGNPDASGAEFTGIRFYNNQWSKITYAINYNQKLATVLAKATADNLGNITYTNEFVDRSTYLNCFAITTVVYVLDEDEVTHTISGSYKTLMLVLNSSLINDIIGVNDIENEQDLSKYSNAIIDRYGNYVFTTTAFHGKTFIQYLSIYNDSFTADVKNEFEEELVSGNYNNSIFFNNNKNEECTYTIVPVKNMDWYILSCVPTSSFQYINNSYQYYLLFITSLLFFVIINMSYIYVINRRLRRKTKEANDANIAKSQFLSSMSHDIRTPMNAIVGMTDIAKDEISNKSPDINTINNCLKIIDSSSNHLLTLINDILDISKIESGKVELVNDEFSITDSLARLVELIQPQLKEKNFDFKVNYVNITNEIVDADEVRINQVFLNILSNAIKYTNNDGRIELTLKEEKIPNNDSYARYIYTVKDNGIGMSEDYVKTIFNRFSRAVDTRINKIQGTGLGMSIVKQLVDLMKGNIDIYSVLNEGSTFIITLDLKLGTAKEDISIVENTNSVIIDNDEISLANSLSIFEGLNIKAYASTSIDEAITRYDSSYDGVNIDYIFVTWKNIINDIDTSMRKITNCFGSRAKIIVITSYNQPDIQNKVKRQEITAFMSKPIYKSQMIKFFNEAKNNIKKEEDEKNLRFDLNVLVAEDNDVNWIVLEQILHRLGVNASRVPNGQEAIEALLKNKPVFDLILMDIEMPIMNGYDATREIRKLNNLKLARVPIYAMTANTFSEDIANSLASGMDGHLAKPIEIDKLIRILKKIK